MNPTPAHAPNPRRVAAGTLTRLVRRPLTDAGRERLRLAAMLNRPWDHSTGPKSPQGRAQAARNGKKRQKGPRSVREVKADLRAVRSLLRAIRHDCEDVNVSPMV